MSQWKQGLRKGIKLTFETQITISDLGKKNLQETDSTPTLKSDENIETTPIISTQDSVQSHNELYWVFGIGFMSLIVYAIVKAVKRKNKN